MESELLEEIAKRKSVYKTSPDDMISAFHRETEVRKEYNGRQLLELLQNADDESSQEVQIEIDTSSNRLSISNKGDKCRPFSVDGIKSLMISNLSSKLSKKKYIGNKGLGFRSLINWSHEVTILSNNLEIQFSKEIIEEEYNELFNEKEHIKNVEKRKLPVNVKPIPLLSIPKITKCIQNDWTTVITINYLKTFEEDIKKQILELKDEILLFLNHIEELVIVIDNEITKRINKKDLFTQWTIYSKTELLEKTFWDKETEEEFYDLRIALRDDMKNDVEELFAYFPTKVDIKLPFIVHGTFELNSSRNEIIDSEKNKYILQKLVELIIETAKKLSYGQVSYKALEMLSYEYENYILREFGFYSLINEYIHKADIFPCIDGTYRSMGNVTYSNNLSKFIYKTKNEYLFDNLLIPNTSEVNLKKYSLNTGIDNAKLNSLSRNIMDIDERVDYIYMVKHSFAIYEEKLIFLIDQDKNLVEIDDEVYTPPNIQISIPDYLKLKFMNQELYGKLIVKFNITGNDKARELQRQLKEFTNIQSYEPAPIIKKIVSSANAKLKDESVDKSNIIRQMTQSLYENYLNLNSKSESIPANNINLLTKKGTIKKADDLYLSKSYPSGEMTEYLFSGIFTDDDFLADIDIFRFKTIDDIESIELFFRWLGVNKYTKFEKEEISSGSYIFNDYLTFVFQKIDLPSNFRDCVARVKKIDKFDLIMKSISAEKFILWVNIDSEIKHQLNDLENDDALKYALVREYSGYHRHSIIRKPSYILFQIVKSNVFKDYFIGNEFLTKLINMFTLDYEDDKFIEYGLEKEDIDSLLLKIGATNKFENLSVSRIKQILNTLPSKIPDGKNTQTLYKLCVKHYEKNGVSLDNKDLKLFSTKNDEKYYALSQEIYYSGNIKLPKKITDSVAILNFPKRLNTKNVVEFFGINNLNNLVVNVTDFSINAIKTNDFNIIFEQIKPYILVHRIKDLDDEKTIKAQLSKLKSIKILLCNQVSYDIEGKSNVLDNNDYLKENKENTFFIKVDQTEDVSYLVHEFDFQETFSDIIGLVFDIQETRVFRDLIKEKLTYIEKSIANDFGYDIVTTSRELLGISDEVFSFWKNIFKLLGKDFEYVNSKNLVESVISKLMIKTDISELNYKKLTTYDNCIILASLFKELKLIPKEFNLGESFYKVSFEEMHKRKLKQLFEDSFISFQKLAYAYCLTHNQKENFVSLYSQFEMNDTYISIVALKNKLEIEVDYEEKIVEYIYESFEYLIDCKPTTINYQSIYDENAKAIKVDALDGNLNLISLLFFENSLDILNEYIDKKNIEIENSNKSEFESSGDDTNKGNIKIIRPELKTPSPLVGKSAKTPYKYNDSGEKKKKLKGYSSEETVYQKLLLEYGEDSVVWSSKTNDSLGYDIKYKNENNQWKFVEVKTYSSSQFFLTENEKNFANRHLGNYEIFLVKGIEIYIIENVDFNDDKRFIIEPNQYIVRYII